MNRYEVDKLLGEGAFGTVYLYRRRDTNQLMAQKEIKLGALNKRELSQLLEEVKVLEKFRVSSHRNLVEGKGYLHTDDILCIYMEYCERGSLAADIKSRQEESRLYDETTILDYAHQIASGLAHMHQHLVIHRDLKPANILVTRADVIKLADFGLGALLSSESSLRASLVGTTLYMAPEIFKEEKYNFNCDIWAFGTILYELMALKPAFMARTQAAAMMKILSGQYNPLDNSYSEPLKGLVKLMLVADPSKRPDSSSIVALKFLSDRKVDFSSMGELETLLSKKAEKIEREKEEEELRLRREAEEKKRVEVEERTRREEAELQRRKDEELKRREEKFTEKLRQDEEWKRREEVERRRKGDELRRREEEITEKRRQDEERQRLEDVERRRKEDELRRLEKEVNEKLKQLHVREAEDELKRREQDECKQSEEAAHKAKDKERQRKEKDRKRKEDKMEKRHPVKEPRVRNEAKNAMSNPSALWANVAPEPPAAVVRRPERWFSSAPENDEDPIGTLYSLAEVRMWPKPQVTVGSHPDGTFWVKFVVNGDNFVADGVDRVLARRQAARKALSALQRDTCPPANPVLVLKAMSIPPPVKKTPLARRATMKKMPSFECSNPFEVVTPEEKKLIEEYEEDTQGWGSALHRACYEGKADIVTLLIHSGADVHYVNKCGQTPLNLANQTVPGSIDVVTLLIQNGADIHHQDNYGYTSLHRASDNGNTEVVTRLIQCGADVDHKANDGCTPLHLASKSGRPATAEVLIKAGASINAQNSSGQTPLHMSAARAGRDSECKDVVKLLLRYKANESIKDSAGWTPKDVSSNVEIRCLFK